MKYTHDKKLKLPEPTLSQFKVGDLVWSPAPPSTKSDLLFPDIVWVVIGLKASERTKLLILQQEIKLSEMLHTCDMYHSIRHAS